MSTFSHRLAIALLLLGVITPHAEAGSIWAKRSKNARDVFTDDVARNVGDIITILISESSKIDNKAKRDLQKTTDRSANLMGITESTGNLLPLMPVINIDAKGKNDLKSKADYQDERSFEDQITVMVIDILPNRNLVVAGTRRRDIAGDIQTVEVSGIVRPSDISFSNTVQSQQIANFCLVTVHKGISDPYTKPGWFGRVLDVAWPF